MERKRRSRSGSASSRSSSKRGRRSRSASSFNDDDSWSKKSDDPTKLRFVSNWTRQHLEKFALHYNKNVTPITELFSWAEEKIAKQRGRCKIDALPEITNLCVKLMKDQFNLSLPDFDWQTFAQRDESIEIVKKTRDSFLPCLKEAEERHSTLLSNCDNRRIFYVWYSRVLEFLNNLPLTLLKERRDFLEADFQWIFMKFSEIFLLTPQHGNVCKREMTIQGEPITCVTDVRFVCYPAPESNPCLIVMITEVKQEKGIKSSADTDFNINASVTDEVLGQLGGEMLFESQFSIFFPGVIGVLCAGTKLLVLYCEVTAEHFKSISRDDIPAVSSKIYFTKTYDYMISAERDEILKYLFWLGHVQSTGYMI